MQLEAQKTLKDKKKERKKERKKKKTLKYYSSGRKETDLVSTLTLINLSKTCDHRHKLPTLMIKSKTTN